MLLVAARGVAAAGAAFVGGFAAGVGDGARAAPVAVRGFALVGVFLLGGVAAAFGAFEGADGGGAGVDAVGVEVWVGHEAAQTAGEAGVEDATGGGSRRVGHGLVVAGGGAFGGREVEVVDVVAFALLVGFVGLVFLFLLGRRRGVGFGRREKGALRVVALEGGLDGRVAVGESALQVGRAVAVGVLRVLAVVGVVDVHAGRLPLEHLPGRRSTHGRRGGGSLGGGVLDEEIKDVDVVGGQSLGGGRRCWSSWWYIDHGDGVLALAVLGRILDVWLRHRHHCLILPLHRLSLIALLLLLLLLALLFFPAVQMALVFLSLGHAARVRSVFRALEVHHAIDAGVGCAVALVAMRVEFLLGENVAAVLRKC